MGLTGYRSLSCVLKTAQFVPYIGRGGRLKKLHLELTWTLTWFGRVNSLSCVFKTAPFVPYIGRGGRLKNSSLQQIASSQIQFACRGGELK